MRFDKLIKGGEVIDPAAGLVGKMDLAIKNKIIAAVDRNIPASTAAQTIEAEGCLVTPGLIDLHTHVFRGVTFWGIDAEATGARTGVTTWVDAGSAGAYTLPGFQEFIVEPAAVRIFSFLNIASIGLVGHNYELQNLAFSDADLFMRMFKLYPDLVLGAKVRMGTPTVGENGTEPLRRAKHAARACGLPLMVHIATGPPAITEILPLLEKGDVLTHCFTSQDMRIIDNRGKMLSVAQRAREAGVIFDLGHGSGSFAFSTAEPLIEAGQQPDVISTDIHQLSIDGPMFDLPTCLSKFLALGMSLPEVIHAATARPAQVIGLNAHLGTLRPGATADIALFKVKHGMFPFYDIEGSVRYGTELLVNALTIVDGEPLDRVQQPKAAPWMAHDFKDEQNVFINTQLQEELRRRGHVPSAMTRVDEGSH